MVLLVISEKILLPNISQVLCPCVNPEYNTNNSQDVPSIT